MRITADPWLTFLDRRILAAARSEGEPVTVSALVRRTGNTPEQVTGSLHRLDHHGLMTETDDLWSLPTG